MWGHLQAATLRSWNKQLLSKAIPTLEVQTLTL